ncbi:hypothetical protein HDZ31DRAFT_61496 [Schizophyllum fasciatum]
MQRYTYAVPLSQSLGLQLVDARVPDKSGPVAAQIELSENQAPDIRTHCSRMDASRTFMSLPTEILQGGAQRIRGLRPVRQTFREPDVEMGVVSHLERNPLAPPCSSSLSAGSEPGGGDTASSLLNRSGARVFKSAPWSAIFMTTATCFVIGLCIYLIYMGKESAWNVPGSLAARAGVVWDVIFCPLSFRILAVMMLLKYRWIGRRPS